MTKQSCTRRLLSAGIKTIRTQCFDGFGRITYLEYKGEQVRKPRSEALIVELVKSEWGIDL